MEYHYKINDGDECLFAEFRGLGCLIGKGSFDGIINLNRPVVLKLFNESGKEFYAALITVKDNQAVIVLENKHLTLNIKELGQYWFGDYIILWRKPLDYKNPIRPGDKGKLVECLNEKLSIITKVNSEQKDKTVFDERLTREVKQFQISKGLIPDGIVGPQTIIHLNNVVGSDEPLLVKKGR